MSFANAPRARIAAVLVGALALTGLAAPIGGASSASAAPAEERAKRCARATAPFDVGTTTVRVKSRGRTLSTTVAYPATSSGQGATPVCRKSRLVIAGHGSQGDGASAARLHNYLVQRGYVVAAPTFASSSGYDFTGFATDVSRTITKVRKVSNNRKSVLHDRLKGKVGYIGTSMGAIVGLELVDKGSRDPRINAVVAKAGAHFGRSFRTKGGPPLLMIHGDRDSTVDVLGRPGGVRQGEAAEGIHHPPRRRPRPQHRRRPDHDRRLARVLRPLHPRQEGRADEGPARGEQLRHRQLHAPLVT